MPITEVKYQQYCLKSSNVAIRKKRGWGSAIHGPMWGCNQAYDYAGLALALKAFARKFAFFMGSYSIAATVSEFHWDSMSYVMYKSKLVIQRKVAVSMIVAPRTLLTVSEEIGQHYGPLGTPCQRDFRILTYFIVFQRGLLVKMAILLLWRQETWLGTCLDSSSCRTKN